MSGFIPGGSAGTSFCSGTEISISRLAIGVPSKILVLLDWVANSDPDLISLI
jgi:hypothetical protein